MDLLFCCVSVVVIIGVFIYLRIVRPYQHIKAAKDTPAKHSHAVLISKATEVSPVVHASMSDMYISFEFPDGTRKNFRVNADVYNTILEGEEGILTYHELGDTRVFVSFQRER